MEDPIRFTLWGKVKLDARDGALGLIRSLETYPSEIALRKAVNNATREDSMLQITPAFRLREVERCEAMAEDFFSEMTRCQEGYGPGRKDQPGYCSLHDLHYGGCLGCHICSGFYTK